MTGRHWQILIVLIVAEAVSALEYSMIMAGLPKWLEIHGDPIHVSWLITGYFLVSGSSAALSARLGDVIGRKKVMIALLACCVAGSTISAFGPTLGWVIAGRAVQGFAGGIVALCFGLARENLPAAKVSFAVGAITATATGGAAMGLLLGGILTDRLGPQSIFHLTAVTGAIALLLVLFIVPKSPVVPKKLAQRVDILGGVLMVPAVAALLLTLSNLTRWDPDVLLMVGSSGFILFAIWVWYELRHPAPLIDLRLLGGPRFALANILSALSNIGSGQLTTLSSLLMQQAAWTGVGLGLSATFVGALKFPAMAVGVLGSLWAGILAGRKGGQYPAAIGAALACAAMMLGALFHGSVYSLLTIIIFTTFGGTLIFAGTSALIVAAAPFERLSEATGLNVVVRALCQALGSQLIAIMLASSLVYQEGSSKGLPDESAYTLAFSFMALTCLGALIVAVALQKLTWQKDRDARTLHPAPDPR